MKPLLLCFVLPLVSFCQEVRLTTASEGFIVKDNKSYHNGLIVSRSEPRTEYLFAVKPGFATQVFSMDSIFSKGEPEYKVSLLNVWPLDDEKKRSKLKFSGLVDKTRKRAIPLPPAGYPSPFQIVFVDFTSPEYKEAVIETLNRNNFNIVNDDDVFKQKPKDTDFALAGEILSYQKETKGTPGFIMSIVIRWTLFDVEKQESVFKITTGGYFNVKEPTKESIALKQALRDALGGLIISKTMQDYMYNGASLPAKSGAGEIMIHQVALSKTNDNYIQNAIPSAVTIRAKTTYGSGFLISNDGYILTNYHVIKDSLNLQAVFQNEMELPLHVVAYDAKIDVALCKVQGKGYKAMPLDTGAIVKKIGSDVVAIGTPADIRLGQSVTKGIVSAVRSFDDNLRIQTDVTINQGNSGCMLINKNGEVIGIAVSKMIREGVEGIAFAIPINEALKALNIKIVK